MTSENRDRLYFDFHVIQTVPPSCVNRDDTGSPKTAFYGGARRARVSSQCWKSAMRKMFREHLDERLLGTRTKRIVAMVTERILARDPALDSDRARELATKAINAAGVQTKDLKDGGEAKALFFLSDRQADNVAALALEIASGANAEPAAEAKPKRGGKKEDDGIAPELKKALKNAITQGHGIDMALFGRMVADDPSLNADASAQVAHALSTHKVDNEFDYYTARDDRAPDDNPGADMIGTVEFNSATLYRYATVAVHELFRQLGEDTEVLAAAVREFARAFVASMPTGKQNTFANRTLPGAVMATLRVDRPVNLAGAFEEPVRSVGDSGFAKASVALLARHAGQVYRDFDCAPGKAWIIGEGWAGLDGGEAVSLDGLLKALEKEARDRFPAEGNPA